jgi:hypothetical protein
MWFSSLGVVIVIRDSAIRESHIPYQPAVVSVFCRGDQMPIYLDNCRFTTRQQCYFVCTVVTIQDSIIHISVALGISTFERCDRVYEICCFLNIGLQVFILIIACLCLLKIVNTGR